MSVTANALAYREPGKVPSIVLAVLVHVLLAAFLFFGVHWQNRQSEAVIVELWDSRPVPVAEKAAPTREIIPPPRLEARPRRPEVRPEVKPEPKAVEKVVEPPKPDIALEKKKIEVKKELPKKTEPEPEPKLNFDRSKEMLAQADREMTELKKEAETDKFIDQMRRDGAMLAAKADATYIAKLKGKIKSNVVLPPNIPGDPEAIFDVVQLPTGEVRSVKLRKTSGFKAYDDAVERAILKSSPLPRPDRPEQFQPSLEIKFRPLELK